MDTSGPFPILVEGEPVSNVPAYTEAMSEALTKAPVVCVELINSDQVLGTSTVNERPIAWNEREGTSGMNTTANPERLIAPVAGFYSVEATVIFSNVAGGQRAMGFQLWRGGVRTYRRGQNNMSPSASYFAELNANITAYLAAGDYVVVTCEAQTPAASISIKASQGTRAAMALVRY